MLRTRVVALVLFSLASPLAAALGLGPLEASSALNEPFKGRIEIIGAEPEDYDALTVGLASEEQFARAGIARNPVLFQLRFAVDSESAGKDAIVVTSKDSIREPFLNFLLELNWANGRLLREYTVLLDPPLYDPNRRQVAAPAMTAAPLASPAAAGAPAAVATPVATTGVPVAAAAAGYTPGAVVGPVGASATLWSLASAHRPHAGVSVQQMMLALLRENPEAFSQANINMLRRGAVLRLPEVASVEAIGSAEAYEEVRRQHQVWEEYRQQIGAAPAPQPLGATTAESTAAAAAAPATPATDARLELVAPGGTDGGGTPGEGSASGGDLLSAEHTDASGREAAELREKLTEAEEIIDLLQRQVNIKDEELAALQARLAELGIEHGDLATGEAAAGATPAPEVAGAITDQPTAAPEAAEEPAAAETPVAEAPAAADEVEIDLDADAVVSEEPAPSEELEIDTGEQEPAVAEAPAATEDEVIVEEEAAPASAAGFPANLVPSGVAAAVPGGAMTLLAVAALVILGLFAVVAQTLIKARQRGEQAMPAAKPAAASETTQVAADEDATITAPTAAATTELPADEDSEAPTEVPFDPNATVEAEPAVQPDASTQGDPLEEVNVYLAYERFDQAAELVKRVIGQYPQRHEYKLRLLEVYYSSNDRLAYEAAARELFDAVGADDPLWSSAVAMWSEMSPERALFEEGAAADAAPAAPAAGPAFVDITGDADTVPGESTIAHLPGAPPSTGLDFDLGAVSDAEPEILDLTAAAGDAVLDLTAGEEEPGMLDLTAGDDGNLGMLDLTTGEESVGEGTAGDLGMFDLSGGDDGGELPDLEADTGGMLDITGGASGTDDGGDLLDVTGGGDLLDLSGADGMGDLDLLDTGSTDLLDVTRTGDTSNFEDEDILNVTASSLRNAGDDLGVTATLGDAASLPVEPAEEPSLDFDISDTVAPLSGGVASVADDELTLDDDEPLVIEAAAPPAVEDDVLEFDIGGLDDGDVDTVELKALPDDDADGLDLDLGGGGDDIDFDITMGAEDLGGALAAEATGDDTVEITLGGPPDESLDGELSLQGSALDELALDGAELAVPATEDDFDFSLDGTTEMDALAADDTLDMASVSNEPDEEASLDELTMELDQAMGGLDDGFQLDIGGVDESHAETVSLDLTGMAGDDDDTPTLIMPRPEGVEQASDSDEADTKLNLAKAYIELGDTDGARSILEEVVNDGNPAQQDEARGLLAQLA